MDKLAWYLAGIITGAAIIKAVEKKDGEDKSGRPSIFSTKTAPPDAPADYDG